MAGRSRRVCWVRPSWGFSSSRRLSGGARRSRAMVDRRPCTRDRSRHRPICRSRRLPRLSAAPETAFASTPAGPAEWRQWGNTIGGTRYAPISQINTGNVDRLEVAWAYDSNRPSQLIASFEATPLAADGRLYICLQPGIVSAVDQDTGREIWRYTTPGFEKLDFMPLFGGRCRGVSYYEAPHPSPIARSAFCSRPAMVS